MPWLVGWRLACAQQLWALYYPRKQLPHLVGYPPLRHRSQTPTTFPPNLALKPSLDSFPSIPCCLHINGCGWAAATAAAAQNPAEGAFALLGLLCLTAYYLCACVGEMHAVCHLGLFSTVHFFWVCRILLAQPQGWHHDPCAAYALSSPLFPYFHNICACWWPLCCLLSS